MELVWKTFRVFFVFTATLLWSVFAFVWSPFTSAKKAARGKDFARLTKEAIEKLDCQATSVFLTLPSSSIRLHAVEAGPESGPLVVLLHGFPESWYTWKHVIPKLAKDGFKVVAVDMRGYSFSDKPVGRQNYHIEILAKDVHDVITAKKRKSAYVIAHDWGAAVAWAFAYTYPEALDKLVILNCPHPAVFARQLKTWKQLLKSWYMFFFSMPYLPEAFMTHDSLQTAKTFFKTKRKDGFSKWDIEYYASSYVQPGAMTAMLNYYRSAILDGLVKKRQNFNISKPVMEVWGKDDVAMSPEGAECQKYVPNLVIHYVDNCSHWVQEEIPEKLNEYITGFLSQ